MQPIDYATKAICYICAAVLLVPLLPIVVLMHLVTAFEPTAQNRCCRRCWWSQQPESVKSLEATS